MERLSKTKNIAASYGEKKTDPPHTECEVRLGPFEDPWGFECMGPSFRVIATPRKH